MTHFKSKFIKTENLGIKSPLSLLEVSFGKGDLSATLTKQVLHQTEGRTNISITSPALRLAEGRTRENIRGLGSTTSMHGGEVSVCTGREKPELSLM